MTKISVLYSCYDNSLGHCDGDCDNLSFDANTIFDDPVFVDAANDDYHLKGISPCIDDGFNDYNTRPTDLDGAPRIYNDIIDMGVFEWQGWVSWFYSVRSARPELKHTIVTALQTNKAYNC